MPNSLNTTVSDVELPSGFTPGPWEISSIPGHETTLKNKKGEVVCKIRSGMMPSYIDARLIAAAPQMHADLARLRAENERLRFDVSELYSEINRMNDEYRELENSHSVTDEFRIHFKQMAESLQAKNERLREALIGMDNAVGVMLAHCDYLSERDRNRLAVDLKNRGLHTAQETARAALKGE